MEFFGVVVLFFGLFGVIAIIGIFSERKRRQQLKGLAQSMGLKYAPNGLATLVGELSWASLVNHGENRKAETCLYGSYHDVEVAVFDYRYDTGGSSPTTYHHCVAYVQLPMNLPVFRLKPSNIFHRIGNLFGYSDINFDSHPTFSSRYHLSGASEAAIRKAFAPKVLDYCERESNARLAKCEVEGKANRLIVWRNGTLKPKDVQPLLQVALQLGELFRTEADQA